MDTGSFSYLIFVRFLAAAFFAALFELVLAFRHGHDAVSFLALEVVGRFSRAPLCNNGVTTITPYQLSSHHGFVGFT